MRGFLSSLFVVGKDTAKSLAEKTVIEGANLVDNIKEKAAKLDEKRDAEISLKIRAIEKEYGIISIGERMTLEFYFKANDMKSLAEHLKGKQDFKEAFQS